MKPASRQLKIAHLISGLLSGGAEAMLDKLVRRMDAQRWKNSIISMSGYDAYGDKLRQAGFKVTALGMRPGLPDPRGAYRLARVLSAERPDILQCWMYHADLLGLPSARLLRVPRVVWNIRASHFDQAEYKTSFQVVLRAHALAASAPDAVIVNSECGRRVHAFSGHRPRAWRVIPNGFDLDVYRPRPEDRERLRAGLGVSTGTILIGMIARFDPMKDHRAFMRAARSVVDAGFDARFVLVGRGCGRGEAVERLVVEHGLSAHVELLGERWDIPALIASLDLCSLSSAYGEGFPNVVGEAMASGVPCIVTDVGDSAIIVGETGWVVRPRDWEGLATAWVEAIRVGEEGRRRLGNAARRRIALRYSLPAVVGEYERLYEELSSNVRDRRIT